ncbi:hypothetical protein [Escherichia phage IMM-001]|nr:hypothetical protein [Escherichia phage IMM-001]
MMQSLGLRFLKKGGLKMKIKGEALEQLKKDCSLSISAASGRLR